jgi:hypothetical protein
MTLFYWSFLGFFFGFFFGVGCALAVVYSIYIHGYRKAMEDSLLDEKSDRYRAMLPKVVDDLVKKRARARLSNSGDNP